MANTGLPSNLYSGGAVVFNSQPSVNFYAQLMQRQQAKRDALDQYYQKALMDVTPAGMRNVDITGGFTKKLNDWQEFAMNPQNRKYLLNPRLDQYKTATQFNQMHADLLSDIQKSKEAAADEKTLNTYRLNGRWNPTDDDLNIAHNMGLSIYDPIRKDVGLNDLSVNMPQYTPLQEKQAYQAATQGLKPSKTLNPQNQRIDKQAGLIYTPFTISYTPEQVKQIADTYGSNLTRSALSHYEQLMHDPNIYDAASKAYQQVYGNNDIIDNPIKMAKGIAAIHALGDVQTGEDKAPNYTQREADVMKHIYVNASLRGAGGQNYQVSDLQLPDGSTDLTKPLQGINVNSLVTGKSFKSDKINYNPITKEVTYHDVVDDKDYTVPQSKFRQIINTINTVQDLKTYDNLIETIDKAYTKPNKKVSTKVKLHW